MAVHANFIFLPRPLPLTDSPGRGRWHEVPEGEQGGFAKQRRRGLGRFRNSRNKKQGLLHAGMCAAAPFVWGTCRAACGMHSRGRWLLKMMSQFMRRFLRSSTKPAASRNMPLRAVPTTASQFAPVWGRTAAPLAVSTAEEAVFTVPSRWR